MAEHKVVLVVACGLQEYLAVGLHWKASSSIGWISVHRIEMCLPCRRLPVFTPSALREIGIRRLVVEGMMGMMGMIGQTNRCKRVVPLSLLPSFFFSFFLFFSFSLFGTEGVPD